RKRIARLWPLPLALQARRENADRDLILFARLVDAVVRHADAVDLAVGSATRAAASLVARTIHVRRAPVADGPARPVDAELVRATIHRALTRPQPGVATAGPGVASSHADHSAGSHGDVDATRTGSSTDRLSRTASGTRAAHFVARATRAGDDDGDEKETDGCGCAESGDHGRAM